MYFFIISEVNTLGDSRNANSVRGLKCDEQGSGMIAKVQPSKQKSRSSFKRLLNYLTKEVDPETGETLLRGEAVLSNNLVGIDTALAEMKAVESLNLRCDDAVCHYELAWPPGERPTRAQWMDAAEYTHR
jgi:hypothetical protein